MTVLTDGCYCTLKRKHLTKVILLRDGIFQEKLLEKNFPFEIIIAYMPVTELTIEEKALR